VTDAPCQVHGFRPDLKNTNKDCDTRNNNNNFNKCELAVWLSDYHYPIYLNRFTKDTLEKLHCSAD